MIMHLLLLLLKMDFIIIKSPLLVGLQTFSYNSGKIFFGIYYYQCLFFGAVAQLLLVLYFLLIFLCFYYNKNFLSCPTWDSSKSFFCLSKSRVIVSCNSRSGLLIKIKKFNACNKHEFKKYVFPKFCFRYFLIVNDFLPL